MSHRFHRPLAGTCCFLAALALCLFLSGCGGDDGPVTAEKSKFKAAGGGKSGGDAGSTDAGTSEGPTAGASIKRDSEVPDSPFTETKGSKQPANAGRGDKIPDENDPEALVQFFREQGERRPRGSTRQEQMEDLVTIQESRLEAGKKALAGKLDKQTRTEVINGMQEIHLLFMQLGLPDATERMNAFAGELAASKDPEIAEVGRLRQFEVRIMQIVSKQPEEGDEIVAEIKQLVESEKKSPGAFAMATQMCQVLAQFAGEKPAMRPALLEALTFVGNAYKDDADAQVASQAKGHLSLVKRIELDLPGKLDAALANKEGAEEELLAAINTILAESEPNEGLLSDLLMKIAYPLESDPQRSKLALAIFDAVAGAFKDNPNKDLANAAVTMAEGAHKRAALIGQPFEVTGVKPDGSPFSWADYAGKVVLVDFWATWCGPCIQELPNIKRNYRLYKDQGFDVVGVSLDSEMEALERFLSLQDVPWTIVVSPELAEQKQVENGFKANPLTDKCGIDAIPFVVLVGKDGKVDSIHVRGEKLGKRLEELLGEPSALKDLKDLKAKGTEEGNEKGKEGADAPPAKTKPPAASADNPQENGGGCSADEPAEQPAEEPAAAAEEESKVNPYSAKAGLSTADLVKYIEKMIDKPKSIQGRPGFAEALVEACDRVLAAEPAPKEADVLLAAETKFDTLHKAACNGDAKADEQLAAFCEKMKADSRPRIASHVAFFTLERKVLESDKVPPEQIEELLGQLKDYFAKESLTQRHLRIASSTVSLINRLEDGDAREKHFASFGGLFARSSDKELARYGKKLAKKPAATESDLVGKEMELAGATATGGQFDWKKYRGKVVLVDFWATWCGPCRREMPHVKELYERLHDKGLEVVGVSLDKDSEALSTYLEENQIAWETLAGDDTQELAEKYGVRGIPTMMVVDKEGKILGVAHQLAALTAIIEKAL